MSNEVSTPENTPKGAQGYGANPPKFEDKIPPEAQRLVPLTPAQEEAAKAQADAAEKAVK